MSIRSGFSKSRCIFCELTRHVWTWCMHGLKPVTTSPESEGGKCIKTCVLHYHKAVSVLERG